MFLLFDIGGTNMRIAISKDGKSFEEPKIVTTPRDFNEGMERFKKVAEELSGGKKIKAVAGGIASPLGKNKEIINPPNILGWRGKNLKQELERIFNASVYLENDADLAGLGEALRGAGKGSAVVAYLTIGTGVGGTRIVDGKIDRSAFGFEPGHQIIDAGKFLCPSCELNTLESYIGGSHFERRYGRHPQEIKDKEVWDKMARFLAYGLNNIIVLWSPDVVVLGGSMMKEVGIPIERVRYHLKDILKIFPELPLIQKAELGDIAGLYGALEIIRKNK